jgi:hypothetical protein
MSGSGASAAMYIGNVRDLLDYIRQTGASNAALYSNGGLRNIAFRIQSQESNSFRRTEQEIEQRIQALIPMLRQIPMFATRAESIRPPLTPVEKAMKKVFASGVSKEKPPLPLSDNADVARLPTPPKKMPQWALGLRSKFPRILFTPPPPVFGPPPQSRLDLAFQEARERRAQRIQARLANPPPPLPLPLPPQPPPPPKDKPTKLINELTDIYTEVLRLRSELRQLMPGAPDYLAKKDEVKAKEEEIHGPECVCADYITVEEASGDNGGIIFCTRCGNALHVQCSADWINSVINQPNPGIPYCPSCKTKVGDPTYNPFSSYNTGRRDIIHAYQTAVDRVRAPAAAAAAPAAAAAAPAAAPLADDDDDDADDDDDEELGGGGGKIIPKKKRVSKSMKRSKKSMKRSKKSNKRSNPKKRSKSMKRK